MRENHAGWELVSIIERVGDLFVFKVVAGMQRFSHLQVLGAQCADLGGM